MANNKEFFDRLKKISKIEYTSMLGESEILDNIEFTPTTIPALNIALSGSIDGGLAPGHTAIAGESRHFKTSFALKIASDYMKAKDANLIVFDSEFGSPLEYFEQYDVDIDRVLHVPITNVEEFRTEITNYLKEIKRKEDNVIMMVDSIGGLASLKEIEDSSDGNNKADMTRAKLLKSVFRIITPQLKLKNVPILTINHVYQTMEMFSKTVMSGGTGGYLSADNVWFITRRQIKEGTELLGHDFIINADKSRYIKEKSKIPITVTWEGGISKYSGLIDIATDSNFVVKKNRGRLGNAYYIAGDEETFYEKEAIETDEFWNKVFETTEFKKYVEEKYKL